MENKEIKVADGFRSNELSLEEGGATVRIVRTDGAVLVYDKIKSVRAYTQRAAKNSEVSEVWHGNMCLFKREKNG